MRYTVSFSASVDYSILVEADSPEAAAKVAVRGVRVALPRQARINGGQVDWHAPPPRGESRYYFDRSDIEEHPAA